ncbi:MAG: C-terminal helicase domain-containing protein, partial [Chloroflexi bacterium]|nr:C-terminal helicase domain-containing protein [Chloroflexota bacterium]
SRIRTRPAGPTIVYVTLQKTAERVAEQLSQAGLPARAYHAGMEAPTRTAVQEWWMASEASIVVATIAFGMGIDKSDVRYVYHYNLPKSLESYSQEIGRAGRDGQTSIVEMFACAADLPVLENFSYGDTPTARALRSVLEEVLNAGQAFSVSMADLSSRHDVRQLVLRTLLTYLELLGVVRQGTPSYAAYEIKPLVELDVILDRFDNARRSFLADVFAAAKKGRIWYSLRPGEVALNIGSDRDRIVRAFQYLEEHQLVEVRASEVRLSFVRTDDGRRDIDELVPHLEERFQRREAMDIARLQHVVSLVELANCQVNALVGYFGEQRHAPCGHCTYCETGQNQRLLPTLVWPPIETLIDLETFRRLCRGNPEAMGEPRQQARFLCGLSSPALSHGRLSRHSLFGALEAMRFGDVLAWCSQASH